MYSGISAKELTENQKIALVSGTDFMYTNPIPKLGIPSVSMADGPHGLRKQTGKMDNGISESEPSTAFPTAACTASGWNPENARRIGEAIADECRYYGVDILLGPGVNIKRNPLCGRSFEYFSEDPLLAGKMGAAEVQGVQSRGVGVSLKHFALNNSENFRFMGDSVCDMRAIREIYLKPFETVVRDAAPKTVMCAYNKINGVYCSENGWLMNSVLRDEWGFVGAVMTDWGAMHDRPAALSAGVDLEMPGDTPICRRRIADAIAEGRLSARELDRSAQRILALAEDAGKSPANTVDFEGHHALAAEIAADCAVLMKNDGIFPLSKNEDLMIVGELFEHMRYQGAGSSMINATRVTSPKDAFDARGIRYTYAKGYRANLLEDGDGLVREALSAAEGHGTVLIFAGLTDFAESEGCDREHMRLPQNQLDLIKAMIEAGKRIALVLYGGSVVELDFEPEVAAILNMLLPGQNGGSATADILFGDVCPSGKLAESWPLSYSDVPFGAEFGKSRTEVYKESIFVGYRYYATAGVPVRYPFGYGLSYTRFEYGNMTLRRQDGRLIAEADITNVGDRFGAEVVQLYVSAPKSRIFKPDHELRDFAKVYLAPGQTERVELSVTENDLAYYDIKQERYILEGGEYELRICSDSMTVRLRERVDIVGESPENTYSEEISKIYSACSLKGITEGVFSQMSGIVIPKEPPRLPITLESRFTDLKQTFMGRILFSAVLSVAHKQMRAAKKLPEGEARDNKIKGATFLARVLESGSLISMSMSAGKSFPYNFACGFRDLANGHIFRGAMAFLKNIKAPALPKEEEK